MEKIEGMEGWTYGPAHSCAKLRFGDRLYYYGYDKQAKKANSKGTKPRPGVMDLKQLNSADSLDYTNIKRQYSRPNEKKDLSTHGY